MSAGHVGVVEVRARYAETDQMGVVHHANYLVWCELGRTAFMREQGLSYRTLEAEGLRLPVARASLRFRRPARYDDLIRIRSWVRQCGSRLIEFGNAIESADDDLLLATAQITLMAVDHAHGATTIPTEIRERLAPVADPVRL